MSGKCVVCEKDTTKQCSNCHGAFYCSKEHQIEHRKTHKADCKPVQIKECQQLGRYLVATKDLNGGDILFKEKPIVFGPPLYNLSPMCLGCYISITPEDSYCPCPKCGWPMCDKDCYSSPNHKPECDLIVAQGCKVDVQSLFEGFPLYQCVVVMRCLYLKNAKPEMWDKLMKLESHSDDISLEELYLPIANDLKNFLKGDTFTFEEISKVCRIILVNGFSGSLMKGNGIVCVYNISSLFEHRCICNCNKTIEPVGINIVITAAVDIKAGEHVSICYTNSLFGTLQRRQELKMTKCFNCLCQRCEDVTEMGTMYGALKCQNQNCGGCVLPKSFILEKQTESDWFCNKCTTVLKSDSAQEIYDRIKEEYYTVQNDVSCDSIKMFLRRNLKFLSKCNEFVVRAKVLFAQLFHKLNKNEILLENLTLARNFAEDVSNVFDVIMPGEIEARGIVLITLHHSWFEDFQRKLDAPEQRQCLDSSVDYLIHYKRVLQMYQKYLKHIEFYHKMFALNTHLKASNSVSNSMEFVEDLLRKILISKE